MIRPPPGSSLFPSTTLFRSARRAAAHRVPRRGHGPPGGADDRVGTGRRRRRAQRRGVARAGGTGAPRTEEHTSEIQSRQYIVCRLLLEKKNKKNSSHITL